MMRQPVGVRIERAVAQRAILEDHRDRIRRARRLRRKQLRQRRARHRHARWRSSPAAGVALRRSQHLEAPIARSGAATAAASSRTSRAPSAATLPRSNRSGR